jgi:hypothetical protein
MASAPFSSIRPMYDTNGDENKNPRIDEISDKLDSKLVVSRPLAPIDSNQLRQTQITSTSKASKSQKLQSLSQAQSSDDSNSVVTIEEVRKTQDGNITIHRYVRGKLLGKVSYNYTFYKFLFIMLSPVLNFCLHAPPCLRVVSQKCTSALRSKQTELTQLKLFRRQI